MKSGRLLCLNQETHPPNFAEKPNPLWSNVMQLLQRYSDASQVLPYQPMCRLTPLPQSQAPAHV